MATPPPPRPNADPGRTEDVRRILARLSRLRTRIRAIFAAIGISRWLVYAVGCLALFFLADRLLDLPLGVRQFVRLGLFHPPAAMPILVLVPSFLVAALLAIATMRRRHGAAPLFAFVLAGLLGLFVYLALRLLFPVRVELPAEDLALSVESRFHALKDRLAAALDFERELAQPTRGESAEMMVHVVHEAAEAARGLSFSKAVTGRRALRWSGAAVLVLAAAGTLAAVMRDDVGLWARRSLLLEDVSWPRDTHMVAVDLLPDGTYRPHDPADPYEVPIGSSLTIYAEAQGSVPDDAQVLDLVSGQGPLARRMFGVPGKEGTFAYEFLDVRRPFSFVVRGGDDEDDIPRYRVEITIPPRVLSITSTVTFPEYLGLEPETIQDGSVTVPEGAQVAVAFTTDLEIATAGAVLGDDVIAVAPVEGGEGRRFTFAYEATRSGSGRILLKTADGKSNDPAADSFEVRVKPDAPPRLDWTWPRTSMEVTPGGRLPLLARATDDHGVVELAIEVRVNAEEPRRVDLEPWMADAEPDPDVGIPAEATDGELGRTNVLVYLPVEVASLHTREGLPLAPSDGIAFRLHAKDSRGQVRESEWVRADVGAPPALERGLAAQRTNVRLALKVIKLEQEARRNDVRALLEGPLERAELDLLKTVRFAQGKVAQDADRAVQELISVFNGFVYDRLGAQNANAKVLGFLDRHHRNTYGVEPQRSEEPPVRPTEPADSWKGDPVFPYALYDEIVAAWRDKVIYDNGLLEKMCAVLEDAVDVGARLAPQAHRAAAVAVKGDREAIQALLDAQEANLRALDRLEESMKGWQNLSDVTIWLRGMIDEQETLIQEMESKGAPKKAKETK